MPQSWTAAAVRAARCRAQLLSGPPVSGVAGVLERTVAVQAQDLRPARLAFRARTRGLVAADVDRAIEDGTAVRTWAMRGTLHLVGAADAGWLLRVFGARNADADAGRRRRLGLDDDRCARALEALPAVLAGGPLGRREIVTRLAGLGVSVDPAGQAPAHLLMLAASRGIVCRAPEADREPVFALLDPAGPGDGAGDGPSDADLARLAVRYVVGHGPVAPDDLAAWSGLPIGTARRAVAAAGGALTEIDSALGPLYVPAGEDEPRPERGAPVRLLGHFDEYPLGYRDRRLWLDRDAEAAVQTGGGFVMPVVVAAGRGVATWGTTARRAETLVELAPFAPLSGRVARGVAGEIDDLARFLGTPARLADPAA